MFEVGFQNNYVVDDGTRYVKLGVRITEDCRVKIDRKTITLFQPKTSFFLTFSLVFIFSASLLKYSMHHESEATLKSVTVSAAVHIHNVQYTLLYK